MVVAVVVVVVLGRDIGCGDGGGCGGDGCGGNGGGGDGGSIGHDGGFQSKRGQFCNGVGFENCLS